MKVLISFIALIILALQLQANIYDYDIHLNQVIQNYLKSMKKGSKPLGAPNCASLYHPMIQDGVLDIRYAFGYFDDSTGRPQIVNGINYGLSPSLDIAAFDSLRLVISGPCQYPNQRLCEFYEIGHASSGKLVFEKSVPIQNQNTLVRITMTYASASESYLENIGRLAHLQYDLIAQSEENFFDGLKVADVVFYNGHSRDGGGPDFKPPLLTRKKKTDYKGYYQIQKPGIRKTLESLSQNPNPGFILGLFSCYSRSHFYKNLMKHNPQQRLILSADTIDYFDSMNASIGYLEGILRGQCGQDLANTAKKNEKIRRGFQQYQIN